MISLKIGVILVAAAFVAGAFLASPELRAYAAGTITSEDIVDGTIRSIDIGTGQVKASDIGYGQVTSGKIKDGTIISNDISTAFMKHVILNDNAAGNSAGWMPGTGQGDFTILDADVRGTNSIVVVNPNLHSTVFENENGCWVYALNIGSFSILCNSAIPPGGQLTYFVINLG